MNKKHQDTKISLHPLTFDEAITKLVQTPIPDDSQDEKADNTKEDAPEPESLS